MNQLINFARVAKRYFSEDANSDNLDTNSDESGKVDLKSAKQELDDEIGYTADWISTGYLSQDGFFDRWKYLEKCTNTICQSKIFQHTTSGASLFIKHAEKYIINELKKINEINKGEEDASSHALTSPKEFLLNLFFYYNVFDLLAHNNNSSKIALLQLVADKDCHPIIASVGTKTYAFGEECFRFLCSVAREIAKFDNHEKVAKEIKGIKARIKADELKAEALKSFEATYDQYSSISRNSKFVAMELKDQLSVAQDKGDKALSELDITVSNLILPRKQVQKALLASSQETDD